MVTAATWRSLLTSRRFHLTALLVLGVSLYANQLWVGGLPGNDDATYASGALDMMDASDYLTPRFNGDPQFSTAPPLFYWLLVLFFKMCGPADFAARAAGAAATLTAMYLVFFAGLRLMKSLTGAALAAVCFALDPFILKSGHHAVAHTAWAAIAAAALLALFEARQRPAYYLAFAVLAAASILCKSLLGLFPLLIGAVWLVWDKAPRRDLAYFAAASAGSIALGGLWFCYEYARYRQHFLTEHFGQMLFYYAFNFKAVNSALSPLQHVRAVVSRAASNSTMLLPFVLPPLWKNARSETRLILAWAAVPTFCLALTARFEPRYMAPAFPGLALALGWTLDRCLRLERKQEILAAVYAAGLAWALATLAYPIPRGRDFLIESGPLIKAVAAQVPVGGRWLLVVSPKAAILPDWPNRMLVDHYEMDGPVNRGLIQQLLFYTRRRYTAVHAADLLGADSPWKAGVVLGQDKYLLPGSNPALRLLLKGPDWTLYRLGGGS